MWKLKQTEKYFFLFFWKQENINYPDSYMKRENKEIFSRLKKDLIKVNDKWIEVNCIACLCTS